LGPGCRCNQRATRDTRPLAANMEFPVIEPHIGAGGSSLTGSMVSTHCRSLSADCLAQEPLLRMSFKPPPRTMFKKKKKTGGRRHESRRGSRMSPFTDPACAQWWQNCIGPWALATETMGIARPMPIFPPGSRARQHLPFDAVAAPAFLCNIQFSVSRGSGAMIRQAATLSGFLSLRLHGQEGTPAAERCGRRCLPSQTGMERRTCWDPLPADGRERGRSPACWWWPRPGSSACRALRRAQRLLHDTPANAASANGSDAVTRRVIGGPVGSSAAGPDRWAAAARPLLPAFNNRRLG